MKRSRVWSFIIPLLAFVLPVKKLDASMVISDRKGINEKKDKQSLLLYQFNWLKDKYNHLIHSSHRSHSSHSSHRSHSSHSSSSYGGNTYSAPIVPSAPAANNGFRLSYGVPATTGRVLVLDTSILRSATTTSDANLRVLAKSDAQIIGVIEKGTTVYVGKQNDEWIETYVSYGVQYYHGWIHNSLLAMN